MITYGSTTLTSYNSIVKTEVYYYKSTSATSLSGGSWATTKPTWENGKYIWQKIRTIYEDGTHSESDPVNITGQQGATGTAAYSYKLNSSDSIIGKTKDGEYTIKKITFSATYKQGTGAVSAYGGRFKIESTTNGSTWKTEYTSSGNEASKEFTIPDDIIAIKCSLYQSDGTTVLLDIVTVPVVKDGIDAIGLRDSIPYYLASDKDTGITRLSQGWTRYRPQLTAEKKYLWVYYVSRYSEGATEPELIEIKDDLVHFVNNGDESPVESCVVDIDPVQDLHGYDSPWPAGGGKNLLNIQDKIETVNGVTTTVSNGVVTLSGTATERAVFYLIRNIQLKSGTYRLNGSQSSLPLSCYLNFNSGNGISVSEAGSNLDAEFVLESDTSGDANAYLRIDIASGTNTNGIVIKPMIRLASVTDATFAPYSNICPITGWTAAKVTRCGKNLIDGSVMYKQGADIFIGTSTYRGESVYLKPGTYTFSAYYKKAIRRNLYARDLETMSYLSGFPKYFAEDVQPATVTFTLTKPTHATFSLYSTEFESVDDIESVQLELGSTATSYEPYQGETYDITFPSESGTVYGGQLNVTTGELVVDRAMKILTGANDENWYTYNPSNYNSFCFCIDQPDKRIKGMASICNRFANVDAAWSFGGNNKYGVFSDHYNLARWYFREPNSDVDTVTKWREWLSENPLQVCYELASPITYHLTPQEIAMFCQENNIFADTGQTAISYYDNQTSTDPYVDYSLTSAFDASTDALDKAKEVAQDLADLGADLQAQIDGKIETWCQKTDPSTAWTTTELKNQHNGDLWYYTGESTSSYKNNTTYKYTASTNKWTAYSASTDLFDKIDAKASIYYGKPSAVTQNLEVGDYLVDSTDGCSYRWDGSKWVKLTDYNAAIDAIEVGGRNLLKWTAKPKANGTYYKKNPEETDGWYAWNSSVGAITETDNGIKFTYNSSTTPAGIVIPLVSLNAVIGETEYVLSFKYRTNLISIGSPYLLCQADGNISYSQAISIIQSETEWKYFNYKIQWSSSSGRNTWAILIPYINTSNGWIEIQNGSMKLEKGNKPTAWTPAPEDIDASIATAQSTADEALAATQPISSKTFADIIGTANDIANASFYFAKVHPTTYTDPWMVKMKIKASVPSDTNFRKTVDITIHGCRSNFISYDSIVANYNSNPIYYLNLYRATQAGIETNKKGHALGFGLRSATSPTDTDKKRTFEVDLLEVDGCTIDWIDTPVKYADMDGTGSTNYVGCTELGITSNGQNATNNGNTYDRIKYSTIKAAEAIARYNIIVGTSAGYKHLKSGTPWDITYPILYADAALNANATGSSNYLTIPFTVTTTQNMTLTPYKPVYIEGTLDGTTFTPIDTTPLTQTVPTSDNGHQYILLGSAYSTTAINLEAEHPIYQFQNGNFVTVAEAASRIGANAENLIKATYAVCSTAAGTNAKTADCMNFELYEGARIQVTFTNANTASAPTLNINNTGAKAIYINKTAASDTNQLLWTAGSKMEFVYDGTGWIAQNVPYALYGTCFTGASTAAKAVTCNEAVICKGTTISVNMTNTNTAADATMNVGSTLAKDIYANGAKLTTNSRFNWRANTTQKFVFDGQVWRMDDDSVKALATAYITEIDDDGIMVHPEDDSTSGWAISDAIQLFKNGISYIKLWIENNIPKIRIGKEDQGHIILDNDSVDIRNDDKVLASFGATSVIGDENDWHQTIAANQITFAKGDNTITYISPDKLYTINAEVADAFYISNYSIRNASDGKLVIGLRR